MQLSLAFERRRYKPVTRSLVILSPLPGDTQNQSPYFVLPHDEEQEDEEALEGVEDGKKDLEGSGGGLDHGQKSGGPGQAEQHRDGCHVLQALGYLRPLAFLGRALNLLGLAHQLTGDEHKDDGIIKEHQTDHEQLTVVEGRARLQEATEDSNGDARSGMSSTIHRMQKCVAL